MHVIVTGAGGMLGGRLARRICATGEIGGRPVAQLTLADIAEFEPPEADAIALRPVQGDLSRPGIRQILTMPPADIVFHVAALASGRSETEFDHGYTANLDATRNMLEAARAQGNAPRFVYVSSSAVFGAPLPEVIGDDQLPVPRTSYGTQKAMAELMIADYSRRGYVDGVALRLPTIIVRPGRPSSAASSFYSSILREPMAGQRAVLPVGRDVRHVFASPDTAVDWFLHAATIDTAPLGIRRALNMPALSATVAELIEALGRVAGPEAVALIDEVPDPDIAAMVLPWPRAFAAERAEALGFRVDTSVDEILRQHAAETAG